MDNRPETPLESDCCGEGCNPCVFDVHRQLLRKWESRQMSGEAFFLRKNLLSLMRYSSFTISEIKEACVDCILIRLKYSDTQEVDSRLFLHPGQHVILRTLTSSRPYTPVSWENNSLVILVKIYSNGKFSKSLAEMIVGEQIDVRGPYGEFIYKFNSFEEILMLSVGTGIAALYPIARSIIDDEFEETIVHLIAGFKSPAHIPLANELRDLSHYWNFSCTIRLSQTDNENRMNGIRLENGHVDKNIVIDYLRSRTPTSTLVLICGTPKFNRAVTQWIATLSFTNFYVFE